VVDDGNSLSIQAIQFVVADASLHNVMPTRTRFLQPGISYGPIVVAMFSDSNPFAPLSDFSAVIGWGDGTTSTGAFVLVSRTAIQSTWEVVGSHTYALRSRLGVAYTVTVSIYDADGLSLDIPSTHFLMQFGRRLAAMPI